MVSCKTPNLGLPQYSHGDHPDFLGEINDAYVKLDVDIHRLQVKSSINEQAIESINGEIAAIRKMLEEVVKNG